MSIEQKARNDAEEKIEALLGELGFAPGAVSLSWNGAEGGDDADDISDADEVTDAGSSGDDDGDAAQPRFARFRQVPPERLAELLQGIQKDRKLAPFEGHLGMLMMALPTIMQMRAEHRPAKSEMNRVTVFKLDGGYLLTRVGPGPLEPIGVELIDLLVKHAPEVLVPKAEKEGEAPPPSAALVRELIELFTKHRDTLTAVPTRYRRIVADGGDLNAAIAEMLA